jgi:hypothetical protein
MSNVTVRTALRARLHISSDHLETNFVPMEEDISWYMAWSSSMSTGREISSIISRASLRACLKAEMITTGWMFRSNCGSACASISPAVRRQSKLHTRRDCHTKNDDCCSSISNFLVLCSAELDHALCGRMRDFDFSKDGMTVICQHDASHRI